MIPKLKTSLRDVRGDQTPGDQVLDNSILVSVCSHRGDGEEPGHFVSYHLANHSQTWHLNDDSNELKLAAGNPLECASGNETVDLLCYVNQTFIHESTEHEFPSRSSNAIQFLGGF